MARAESFARRVERLRDAGASRYCSVDVMGEDWWDEVEARMAAHPKLGPEKARRIRQARGAPYGTPGSDGAP